MPRVVSTRTIAFDLERFDKDLRNIAHDRWKTLAQVARETGVDVSTIHKLALGCVPDGVSLAALCAWSGLDAGKYSVSEGDKRWDAVTKKVNYATRRSARLRNQRTDPNG